MRTSESILWEKGWKLLKFVFIVPAYSWKIIQKWRNMEQKNNSRIRGQREGWFRLRFRRITQTNKSENQLTAKRVHEELLTSDNFAYPFNAALLILSLPNSPPQSPLSTFPLPADVHQIRRIRWLSYMFSILSQNDKSSSKPVESGTMKSQSENSRFLPVCMVFLYWSDNR